MNEVMILRIKTKNISLSILLILHSLWIITNSSSQIIADSSLAGKKIKTILIQGNEKTKSSIILREMKLQKENYLDLDQLEEDRKRIQNLNLFNRVIILAEPEEKNVRITVLVTEQWYFFPYPILFINERDWDKFSYGIGLTHYNFRGRAEILTFAFWLGYNPAIKLEYNNPWFGGKRNLLTQISFYYQKIRSKHFKEEEVNENHLGFQWTLGKKFGHHTFFSFSLGYKGISFIPFIPGQTLSTSGKDRFPLLSIFLSWDHRDLKEYPHTGWIIDLYAKKVGFQTLSVNYLQYSFDLRKYFPLSTGITLALRTKTNLSSGTIPVYDRVFIGYDERVRGHFFEKFEGENMSIASIAIRFPIVPINYFSLSDMPQLSDLKFGISLGIFADTGVTWYQNERIKPAMFQSGAGIGLHFHLPYINLLRIELAFEEKGKKQVIADLNVDI